MAKQDGSGTGWIGAFHPEPSSGLVELDARQVFAPIVKARPVFAQLYELAKEIQNSAVLRFVEQFPADLRSFKRFRRLRIYEVARYRKLFKFFPAAFADEPCQAWVAMAGEIQERIRLGELFAHK